MSNILTLFFGLSLIVPFLLSINILISFSKKKDLTVALFLFTFLILSILNIFNIISTNPSSSSFGFVTSYEFYIFLLFVLLSSFYFIFSHFKLNSLDYFFIANFLVIFLSRISLNFLNDANIFSLVTYQCIQFFSINILVIYLYYTFKPFFNSSEMPLILQRRPILKYLIYSYQLHIFAILTYIFWGFFLNDLTLLISLSLVFLLYIDLFVKYLSISSVPIEGLLNKAISLNESESDAYLKSHLLNVDLEKLELDLDNAMEKDKLFKDTLLTLKKLASYVDVSSHQLSEYLNNNKKVSFSQFLMNYRVEEAKVLLVKYDWRTTMSIGFEVGFNSHSSFGRCFKLVTGESPGAFRSKLNK